MQVPTAHAEKDLEIEDLWNWISAASKSKKQTV